MEKLTKGLLIFILKKQGYKAGRIFFTNENIFKISKYLKNQTTE